MLIAAFILLLAIIGYALGFRIVRPSPACTTPVYKKAPEYDRDGEDDGSSMISPTPRTEVRRLPKRATFEKDAVYDVLDANRICHVAFVRDGMPYVVPTTYGRIGNKVYFHGHPKMGLAHASDVCFNATMLDGFVLARSSFHHSMNYRSVTAFGRVHEVTSPEEREHAFVAIVDHLVPGRYNDARPPNAAESRSTSVMSLELDQCSVKIRAEGPGDDREDIEQLSSTVWGGVIPLFYVQGEPEPDQHTPASMARPTYFDHVYQRA